MLPPLNSIRAFEVAARLMSFQKAAAELNVTPSALSYQIRQLEDFLGVQLFVRYNRAVALSKTGEMLLPKIRDAFVNLNEAFQVLQDFQKSDQLVISTGPAFAAKWLAPRLHSFIEIFPELDLRLSASLNLVDFQRDGVDAGIRFGVGNYPNLFVEPLFDEVVLPLISPQLFAKSGGRTDRELFETTALIHDESSLFLKDHTTWHDWFEAMGWRDIRPQPGTSFSHADHGIEAAVDGAGIIFSRLGFAMRDLKAGRLIAPFDLVLKSAGGFFFVCPQSALDNEILLHFLGWLRDEVRLQKDEMSKFLSSKTIK